MRRYLAIIGVFCLATTLAGCAGQSPSARPSLPPPSPYTESALAPIWTTLNAMDVENQRGVSDAAFEDGIKGLVDAVKTNANTDPKACDDVFALLLGQPYTYADARSSRDSNEAADINSPSATPLQKALDGGAWSVEARVFETLGEANSYMSHIKQLLPTCEDFQATYPDRTHYTLVPAQVSAASLPTVGYIASVPGSARSSSVELMQKGNLVFEFRNLSDSGIDPGSDLAGFGSALAG